MTDGERYYVRVLTDADAHVTCRLEGTSVEQVVGAAKAAIPGFKGIDDVWREADFSTSCWAGADSAAEDGRAR